MIDEGRQQQYISSLHYVILPIRSKPFFTKRFSQTYENFSPTGSFRAFLNETNYRQSMQFSFNDNEIPRLTNYTSL